MLKGLIQSEGRWIHALLVLSTMTVALVLIGLVSNLLVYFSDILLMLVMAWVFAFIRSPLASWIERRLPVLPRVAVVAAVYGLLFVVLSAVVVVIAVNVAQSFKQLIEELPKIQENLPTTLADWQAQLDGLGIDVNLAAAFGQAIQGLQDLSATWSSRPRTSRWPAWASSATCS